MIAVNQGSFPYGGVELARFFDGDQRVAANIGGRPAASFGVVVHDGRSGQETASSAAASTPIWRTRRSGSSTRREAPGASARLSDAGLCGPVPPAGAVGSTYGRGVGIHTRHGFTADYVQTSSCP